MADDVNAVWTLMRAVVDARRAHFQELWIDASYAVAGTMPRIGYSVVDRADQGVHLNVGVSVRRPDGIVVGWSLSVKTEPTLLTVTGTVELEDDDSAREAFARSEPATDVTTAAWLIDTLAAEVCRQRSWLTNGS